MLQINILKYPVNVLFISKKLKTLGKVELYDKTWKNTDHGSILCGFISCLAHKGSLFCKHDNETVSFFAWNVFIKIYVGFLISAFLGRRFFH